MAGRPALRPPTTPSVAPDQAACPPLRFIHEAMAPAASFTAVPSWSGVATGTILSGSNADLGDLPWLPAGLAQRSRN